MQPPSNLSEPPSLRQWFNRNARFPLLVTLLSFLGVEGLLLWVVTRHQLELQTGVAERLAELSKVALEQKSTALLQTGFEIATRELGAIQAFVCEQNKVYALMTPRLSSCEVPQKAGYRVLQVPITQATSSPNKTFSFNLQVPIFPKEKVFYYTLALSLGVCLLGMLFLRRVRVRLEKDIFEPFFQNLSSHFRLPVREFEELRLKLRHFNQLSTQAAVTSALLERNAQVAHDIRSPLTALLFGLKDFESLPEGTREGMRSAVKRIASIVESLSDKDSSRLPSRKTSQEIRLALQEMFNEKKFEYQQLENLQFRLNLEGLSEKAKGTVNETEIKRILSNLINNAVEAMGRNSGSIEIGASEKEKTLLIWISDEGPEVSDEVLSQMGRFGFSHGKKNGQGLGLSHAKAVVEEKGGSLNIERCNPRGIKISLVIPKAQ